MQHFSKLSTQGQVTIPAGVLQKGTGATADIQNPGIFANVCQVQESFCHCLKIPGRQFIITVGNV